MKNFIIFFIIYLAIVKCYAQSGADATKDSIAKATNFSVPSSAAFNLLDVNPSKINRPGFAKDFKFDWVFNGNQISPNIAIEAQPIWLLFAKNKKYIDLQNSNRFQRAIYSIDLSIGTAQKKMLNDAGVTQSNMVQSLAYALKLNLFSAKDPLYNKEFIKEYTPIFSDAEIELEKDRVKAQGIIDDPTSKDSAKATNKILLVEIDKKLKDIEDADKKAANVLIERYEKENWNSTVIDIGYGQLFNYTGQDLGNLQFFDKGSAIWLSGILKIHKKLMFNFMTRYITSTKNPNFTYGGNLRYGSKLVNFFIEGVQTNYEKVEPGSAIKNTTTIAYGGDFKIDNLFYVQLGIRTNYDKELKLSSILPLINFNYLLPSK